MLIALNGFGSVWRQRLGNERNGMSRLSRTAYYNTTGVAIKGVIRTRPKIVGHVRFNGMGGFNPNYPSRMIGRVFECAEPSIWEEQNKVLFRRMLPTPQRSDYFLVVVRPEQVGRLDLTRRTWKSEDSLLISFSEWHELQETMLLMPPYGWLRSDLGTFFLEPLDSRPWAAQLLLRLSARGRTCDMPRVPSN